MLYFKTSVFFILTVITISCAKPNNTLRIALNPWPGYELLYLAEQQGFFADQELDIKLIQIASLSDGLHAFNAGYVDGMASTSIEVLQAATLGDRTLAPVLVTDYSNGGDIIVAHPTIKAVQQLKQKRIGLELNSLGIYVLSLALAQVELSLQDVTLVNVEQLDGERALAEGTIDAFVTYPPISINLTSHYNTLFTSKETPKKILDMVSIDPNKIGNLTDFKQKLHLAWQQTLDYTQQNKKAAYGLMANRENISLADFQHTIENDLKLLTGAEQAKVLLQLDKHFNQMCAILSRQGNQSIDCDIAIQNIELTE
ncbi:ABC transporter substrate-binding protein [Algibacillus agarilyticus]|uniref:ABC transporter substrate-binding protein n=1 Tax=Algibacillus agarilyticus TaxID=2234133 RepID=UPI000DD03652|nr:ABC transporter substrate-binding protein [Algibacillus agarilyticus]